VAQIKTEVPPPLLGVGSEIGPPQFSQVPPWAFTVSGVRPRDAEAFWSVGCAIVADLKASHGVKGVVAFDPMTIMAVIAAVIEAIKFYKQCQATPAQVMEDARENRLGSGARLRRWKLQRIIESKITDREILVDELHNKPADAIMAIVAKQTEPIIARLFAAVG
jgi:hypothetical protein